MYNAGKRMCSISNAETNGTFGEKKRHVRRERRIHEHLMRSFANDSVLIERINV